MFCFLFWDLCWLKYKSLAKTPLLFCKDRHIIGIDKWGRNFFSEFSNPPPFPVSCCCQAEVQRFYPCRCLLVWIHSLPLQKKTNISVIFKKRFALLVRGFNICWGEQETLLMLDIRSVFHIFTNILLHFTCTCITEFFFFLAEPRHYILCVSLKFLKCKVSL